MSHAPASTSGAHHVYRKSTTAHASPVTVVTSPEAMKAILMCIGGPVMPASNSRATVRSEASSGSSRCPIPGGVTHASVSRS